MWLAAQTIEFPSERSECSDFPVETSVNLLLGNNRRGWKRKEWSTDQTKGPGKFSQQPASEVFLWSPHFVDVSCDCPPDRPGLRGCCQNVVPQRTHLLTISAFPASLVQSGYQYSSSVQKIDCESLNNRFSIRRFLHIRPFENNTVPNEVNDGKRSPIQHRQYPPDGDQHVNFSAFALLRLGSWEVH